MEAFLISLRRFLVYIKYGSRAVVHHRAELKFGRPFCILWPYDAAEGMLDGGSQPAACRAGQREPAPSVSFFRIGSEVCLTAFAVMETASGSSVHQAIEWSNAAEKRSIFDFSCALC